MLWRTARFGFLVSSPRYYGYNLSQRAGFSSPRYGYNLSQQAGDGVKVGPLKALAGGDGKKSPEHDSSGLMDGIDAVPLDGSEVGPNGEHWGLDATLSFASALFEGPAISQLGDTSTQQAGSSSNKLGAVADVDTSMLPVRHAGEQFLRSLLNKQFVPMLTEPILHAVWQSSLYWGGGVVSHRTTNEMDHGQGFRGLALLKSVGQTLRRCHAVCGKRHRETPALAAILHSKTLGEDIASPLFAGTTPRPSEGPGAEQPPSEGRHQDLSRNNAPTSLGGVLSTHFEKIYEPIGVIPGAYDPVMVQIEGLQRNVCVAQRTPDVKKLLPIFRHKIEDEVAEREAGFKRESSDKSGEAAPRREAEMLTGTRQKRGRATEVWRPGLTKFPDTGKIVATDGGEKAALPPHILYEELVKNRDDSSALFAHFSGREATAIQPGIGPLLLNSSLLKPREVYTNVTAAKDETIVRAFGFYQKFLKSLVLPELLRKKLSEEAGRTGVGGHEACETPELDGRVLEAIQNAGLAPELDEAEEAAAVVE